MGKAVFLFFLCPIFIFLELLLPSHGILGVMGLGCMVASIVFVYWAHGEWGFYASLIEPIALGLFLYMGFKLFPHTGIGRRLILNSQLQGEKGYRATSEEWEKLVGREGVSLTSLRPAGIAQIGDLRVDVVSDGLFIQKGTPIMVVQVEGNRIVVRPVSKV